MLDLERRGVAATWDLGPYRSPHGIATSRDGALLWVTCEGNRAVLELDARDGRVLRAWETGQEVSHMLAPTPDERKLYVANIRSGSVTVVDRASGAVRSIATGAGAEGVDVTPDGREAWVTNRGANTITVLDTRTDSVVATLPSGGEFPIRIKFTPDGAQAWVSNARSNAVAVFDVRARAPLGTIAVGAMPVGIQMSPDGARAFVANTNDDRVTELDVASRAVLRTFSSGREPDGMMWAPPVTKNATPAKAGSKKST
uniref:YncE family protein n=1 Tax=Eiseniibacteriota bacterium TaxID=2212470 RepID=A0A832MJ12_UNCEI